MSETEKPLCMVCEKQIEGTPMVCCDGVEVCSEACKFLWEDDPDKPKPLRHIEEDGWEDE